MPRPVWHQTKATYVPGWQRPDTDFGLKELNRWLRDYGAFGVALLAGSPFPDGTTLGVADVDHDAYVGVARTLLGNPISGRVGSKGIAYFVRVRGGLENKKFAVKEEGRKEYGQVLECLFKKSICVIPPTIHPKTGVPYRWVGKPLHEVSYDQLPIVEG